MIRILGVSRFPWRVFWSCMALALVAALVPRFFIAPIVAGGALWIASYAVRDEVRRLQMPRSWDR
jgi:hypothetical protein